MFDQLLRDAVRVALIGTALPLGIGALTGLVVSVLQTVTQIQEQSISFASKAAAVSLVLWLAGGFLLHEVTALLQESLSTLAHVKF